MHLELSVMLRLDCGVVLVRFGLFAVAAEGISATFNMALNKGGGSAVRDLAATNIALESAFI